MTLSERLERLHNLNQIERENEAREVSGLAAAVAIGLFLAGFGMLAFAWTSTDEPTDFRQPIHVVKDQGRVK